MSTAVDWRLPIGEEAVLCLECGGPMVPASACFHCAICGQSQCD